MCPDNFTLPRYLSRIGLSTAPSMTADGLTTLMRAQLHTVPFENLDVQASKIVSLVPSEIVSKILDRKRGGYCYEVNGLFAMALEALNVPYRFVAARPMFYPMRRPKTHMAVIATVGDDQFLCDLGFGANGIRAPMRLGETETQMQQDSETFKLVRKEGDVFTLQHLGDDGWANQYEFDLSPQEWVDFVPANYFNSTHPDTIFTQKLLIILQNPKGKTILLDDTLKSISDGKIETKTILPEQKAGILASVFGLSA
jgi:N-hydroxyarylamine O-acetyltransferase